MSQTKTEIAIPDFITIRDLSTLMGVSPINIIKELMTSGILANITQEIDFDTASIVAEEMGFDPIPVISEEEVKDLSTQPAWRRVIAKERKSALILRPPVVTMLGHVDHGKTSLLDLIRSKNVQEGEAGGITQHIGAYQAQLDNKRITFLDTPGHEAFTAMRARGAQATDIAILVVAADDGLMPQTREAIDHARAAHVPIVVALNKIDLPNANVPFVMQQLVEVGLTPDEWDGDTLVIQVSAKEKLGIEDLLEAILLTAEDLEPKANPQANPTGVVLESNIKKGLGNVATILVQNGTLSQGDSIVAGSQYGRIRAIYDFTGKRMKKALPSTPVSVTGLNGLPSAGDLFKKVKNDKEGRKLVATMAAEAAKNKVSKKGTTLEDFFSQLESGNVESKVLSLIIKTDVQGSLEPITNSLDQLGDSETEVKILHASAGDITENDIMLASASSAVIMGFNVKADPAAKRAAASEKVEINIYSVIYHMFEEVDKALKGMLDPIYEFKVVGRAEVRAVFRVRGSGAIAGCYMRTGVAQRNARARIIRNTRLIHENDVSSLKHLQENVREIKTGFEFGVGVSDFKDFKVNDIIEFLIEERVR